MSDTTTLPRAASPYGKPRPKVPHFARFRGTSAWRKDRRRVKEYALFQAAEKRAKATPGP